MSPTRPRALALASAALAIALTATGCGGDAQPGADGPSATDDKGRSSAAPLRWSRCSAPTAAQGGGKAPGKGWECAKLPVPLDHAKPDGEKIELALIRARATDGSHRIGSLVFNFGGPGGSGVATLPGLADTYSTLRGRFDLVSFDPRGVGESAGVRCQSDKELDDAFQLDGTPDDDAELRATLASNKAYTDACAKNSAKVLPHVDTVSAARDLDLIRAALGEEKLHYFGISYGTELGAVYAHLYPKHVGRTVLDAVVDPTQDPVQGNLGQTRGFQLALDDYLKDCASGGAGGATKSRCPSRDEITTLLKNLDATPLPTAQGRKLTQDEAVNGIAAALYSKDTWKYLTAGLQEAIGKRTGNTLLLLFDSLSGRSPDGRYSNLQAANRAISCADAEQRYTVEDVRRRLPEFRAASPVFGESAAWSLLACTDWPVKGRWKTPEVGAEGSAPILVVGNTGDPATPVAGAERMAEKLGKGVGVRLTVTGEGHGTYGVDECATKAVNADFLEGRVPKDGTTCP
ncbi:MULTISPECIES: alpha/beta hydrolase [Streptomyces]|uniref:Alpha/beta fold hydrolase n=1 Tax=Streptomyces griseocarneus TaxID=51201 RepID=A0ABX7RSD6_9ACTN|nr:MULTISPECIES: alpha/beta hydrolase [Streptomyces]QSY51185.1 alpha/beta fold hydrolase [Streptomyces griseocarneus]